MIGTRKWERTLAYVHRIGLVDDIETHLREGRGGRRRGLRVDVLLAAMMLTYQDGGNLTLKRVHANLTTLPLGVKEQYGLTDIKVHNVYYLWSRVTRLHDFSHNTRPGLDAVERAEREERFQHFLDRMAGAAGDHIRPTGRWAADASAIESAARGGSAPRDEDGNIDGTKPTGSYDRDARWGYRTKTYDNKTNKLFGYQLHALVRVGKPGEDVPHLIDRFTLTPGNDYDVAHTIDMFDTLARDGIQPVEVLSDRGYSYTGPEKWATQLTSRGITQVLDMHKADRGPHGHDDGYLMIDGWPHHPSIPEHLVTIERPARMTVGPRPANVDKVKLAAWEKRRDGVRAFTDLMAQRELYRYDRVAKAKTPGGSERYRCPGKSGKIRCEGCATVDAQWGYVDAPHVHLTPDGVIPKACQQATITIRGDVDRKLRQDLPWGSPEWIAHFGRRTRVEGYFGLMKSADGDGSVRRGWTRQVGRVKTGMLLAIAIAAHNLQQLTHWAARHGDTTDPLTTMDTTVGEFVELPTPPAPTDPGTAPPTAA
ncbi:hypothetical protein [Janibacter sp. G368]|uniref:hypothetical protein n=1 Tax=Janibacter sp. G368 TaxID=3420441 RepID=UPI003CFF4A30